MKAHYYPAIVLLTALLAACNLKTTPLEVATPTQALSQVSGVSSAPPTDTPAPLPSNTPIPFPSATPTITLTPTPSVVMVTPKTEAVNCRFGPGTTYLSIGGLKAGESVPILGTNGDGTWWQIQNPNDITNTCWLSASATDTSGNIGSVPVVPAPQSSVTKVTITNPDTISVPGCIGPITPMVLTGTIDVNGPVAVTWHFETQQGSALSSHTLTFTKYGPLTVTDNSYTPPVIAGTYWVRLVITSPNSVKAEGNYSITCP